MLKDLLPYFRSPTGGKGTLGLLWVGLELFRRENGGSKGCLIFLIKHSASLPSLPAFPLSAYSCRDGEGGHSGTEGTGPA